MKERELCFDCGLPLFGYLERGKETVPDPAAADAGVSPGYIASGDRAWHMECAELRRPRRGDEGGKREELFTMRLNLSERGDLTRLIDALDLKTAADVFRWMIRTELLRRKRIAASIRRRSAPAPEPAKKAPGGRSRAPRGAARA